MNKRKNFAGGANGKNVKNQINAIVSRYAEINVDMIKKFSDFPLSKSTLLGLKNGKYFEPTEIQRQAIAAALKGGDILGAAKTGSGKTLAFLIPVLESLWQSQWSQLDGLGALILSPTRELALQIYEVLLNIGSRHDFSAALLIGGTDVQYEMDRLGRTNIVIGTPGRVLQHMDENPNFDCSRVQIFVLDEADRCLDLGFEKQLNAVIENLPKNHQTLLFSATQTKSVRDLARLSLKDPLYVSVHENSQFSTPEQLKQSYVICEEHEKLSMLWSFIRHHLHKKILVFMSSCKQVRYIYEAFRRLQPGMTLLALYGSMNSMKRVDVYQQFCRKQNAVMFATDVAARGLDFPSVDWVLQLDCPPDANEYLHRAGRTARFKASGEALLVLTPNQEQRMLQLLQQKKAPLIRIEINPSKLTNVQKKLENLCVQDANLKIFAQRALVALMRSIYLMSDKEIFDVRKIDYEKLSTSYGLAIAPRVRFLRKQGVNLVAGSKESAAGSIRPNNGAFASKIMSESMREGIEKDDEWIRNGEEKNCDDEKSEKKFSLEKISLTSKMNFNDGYDNNNDDNDDDDVLKLKRVDVFNAKAEEKIEEIQPKLEKISTKPITKQALAKKALKRNAQLNTKIKFDDNSEAGNEIPSTSNSEYGLDIQSAKRFMAEQDKLDRQRFRELVKAKHREQKLKRKRKAGRFDEDEEEDGNFSYDSEADDAFSHLPRLPGAPDEIEEKSDEERSPSPIERRNKRKLNVEKNGKEKKKRKLPADLALKDEEDLAIKLLELS